MRAISKLVSLLRSELDQKMRVIDKSLNECTLELPSLTEPGEVDQRIRELISNNICQGESSQPYHIEIMGLDADQAKKPDRTQPAQSQPVQNPADSDTAAAEQSQDSALLDAESLVGAAEFKQLCRDIHARAPLIRSNGTQEIFLSTAYLFIGNEGYGCEKSADILSKLLKEEQLFNASSEPITIHLAAPPEPMYHGSLKRILSAPRRIQVDLSHVIDHSHSQQFKQLMMELFRWSGKSLVIFRVPYLSKNQTEELLRDLGDILRIHPVVFPLFKDTELRELAERSLKKYKFSAEEDVWPLFQKKIAQESMDGYFYGVHTVRKIVQELISAEEHLQAARSAEERPTQEAAGPVITAEAAKQILAPEPAEPDAGLNELDKMVGMAEVANRVQEMINLIRLSQSGLADNRPAMHMCFTGNPGTGKTTVARMIGVALKEAGILRIGGFHEHHARELCGKYVGFTAPLTTSICQDAYGSVLFLDEAYSLASSDSPRDYGREAIDTLIAQMENHRDDLVVIFAGYPDEMERFLDANPGMQTRIPYHIHFRNYTRQELFEIFQQMLGNRFALGEGFLDCAKKHFDALPQKVLDSRSFGNGRFVRNVYERVCSKAAMRQSSVVLHELTLEAEDFEAAIREEE